MSQVGFFAEAGPLQVFVSGHLIPEDFEYNQVDEPAFVSADEEVRIQQGTEVRLRIVGTRTDASEIVSALLLLLLLLLVDDCFFYPERETNHFNCQTFSITMLQLQGRFVCISQKPREGTQSFAIVNSTSWNTASQAEVQPYCVNRNRQACSLQFCVGSIKDDFLGVIASAE